MKEFLEPHVIISVAVIIGSLAMVAMTFAIVLRDKISGVHVSRTGVEIHTNDVQAWSKIVDRIERIDSGTDKSLRKQTTGLMMIDPEQHGLSAKAMLLNRDAVFPLVCAAYENHHTREIAVDGGDLYLADKSHDISAAILSWKKSLPELTDERIDDFVRVWTKKIMLPNLRRACLEKVAYYDRQLHQHSMSKTLKNILTGCREKNVGYIECIDKLAARLDVTAKTGMFYPHKQNERGEL
jgi:hypothetical protein